MRLKLVILSALISALVGAGSSIAIILTQSTSIHVLSSPDLLMTATLVLPIASVILAAFFVYRHTARRRKTQALLTGILAAFLSVGVFIAASVLTSRTSPVPPQPAPQNSASIVTLPHSIQSLFVKVATPRLRNGYAHLGPRPALLLLLDVSSIH
jgi:multisubunit Na+/H+ antiporter MnhB subunit